MAARKKSASTRNLASVLQSLPLFDDMFLRMQAFNIGLVHDFLLDLEQELLRDADQTPPSTVFVSAFSQLWVFGLYELLRTWRQRAEEVLTFSAHVAGATGKQRQKLMAARRSETRKASAESLSNLIRWTQFKKAARSKRYAERIRDAVDSYERVFRRLEALRVSLAKHEIPSAKGEPRVASMMPGYGRIDVLTGSIQWQIVLKGAEVDMVSRREIAEQCLSLAKNPKRPILPANIQKKIARFSRKTWHSYGVHEVIVTLRSGDEHAGVFVAWSKEIVGVKGSQTIAFNLEDVVDVRLP